MKKQKPDILRLFADYWMNEARRPREDFDRDEPTTWKALPQPTTGNAVADVIFNAVCRHRSTLLIARLFPGDFSVMLPDRFPDATLSRVFGDPDKLRAELGALLLDALTGHDTTFPAKVLSALGLVDVALRRTKRKALFERFCAYLVKLPQPPPPLGEIKEGFERHMSRGRKNGWSISGTEWKEIRDQFGFPGHTRRRPGPRTK